MKSPVSDESEQSAPETLSSGSNSHSEMHKKLGQFQLGTPEVPLGPPSTIIFHVADIAQNNDHIMGDMKSQPCDSGRKEC